MANPRVFVSSTCYDLASERDSLIDFCHGFGFDVALSERGDVFFHPDLHTHEACVSEVGSCNILVLIIGGRFGGRYVVDPAKSITNAEYSAAREAGIPIFTFIKQDVLQDHNVWQSNRGNDFVSQIHYPSIDKQQYAVDIFKFIDDVRLSKNNNSYFSFTLPREIHEHLRKQWAAMFLEGLKQRSVTKQILLTNETLGRLSTASQKIEELAKSIYKHVDQTNAQSSITALDSAAAAKEMFYLIGSRLSDNQFLSGVKIARPVQSPPDQWWQFLLHGGYFELQTTDAEPPRKFLNYLTQAKLFIEAGETKREQSDLRAIEASYEVFKSLPVEAREQVCLEFTHAPPTPESVHGSG